MALAAVAGPAVAGPAVAAVVAAGAAAAAGAAVVAVAVAVAAAAVRWRSRVPALVDLPTTFRGSGTAPRLLQAQKLVTESGAPEWCVVVDAVHSKREKTADKVMLNGEWKARTGQG